MPRPDPPGACRGHHQQARSPVETLYTAAATAYGPRTGKVESSDDRLDLQLSRPRSMGGDDGPGTNPEQLFAAGYAACFHSAMRYGVQALGLPRNALQDAQVTARVHFQKEESTTFAIAVELEATCPSWTPSRRRR